MPRISVVDQLSQFVVRHPGITRQQGFTLLELMVVLAIVLITAGLIIPNLGSLDSKAFDSEIRQAVAILKYARRIAVVEGAPVTTNFTALDPMQKDFALKREQLMASRKATDWISDKLSLKFRTEINQPEEKKESVQFTFFPQGGSTGGVLIFSLDTLSAQIRVDSITGRISAAYHGDTLNEENLDAAF
jgi:general secretion pathway protein H